MKRFLLLITMLLLTPTVLAKNVTMDNFREEGLIVSSGDTFDYNILRTNRGDSLIFGNDFGKFEIADSKSGLYGNIDGTNLFNIQPGYMPSDIITVPKYMGKNYIYGGDYNLPRKRLGVTDSNYFVSYEPVLSYPTFEIKCDNNNHCTVIAKIEGNDFGEIYNALGELLSNISFYIVSDEYNIDNIKIPLFMDKPDGNHIVLTKDNMYASIIGDLEEADENLKRKFIDSHDNVMITYSTITSYENGNIQYGLSPVTFPMSLLLAEEFGYESENKYKEYEGVISSIYNHEPKEDEILYFEIEYPLVTFDANLKPGYENGGMISLKKGTIGISDYDEDINMSFDFNAEPFSSKVEEVKGVEEVTENPKTGIVHHTLLILLSIITLGLSYKYIYKKNMFKKI
ncbi:MAG: hypothetical protein K6C11_04470 [Bacilli bacterium]|nr:hypothetical protein [Bacilli bacterium]